MAESRPRMRKGLLPEEKGYGKRIAKLLEDKTHDIQKSESWVAEQLEINKSTLSTYKYETAVPDLITARRMAKLFGVSIDYIAGLTESKIPEMDDRAASDLYGLSGDALTVLRTYQLEYEKDGVYGEAQVGLNSLLETSKPHLYLALICRYMTYLFESNNYVEISDNLDDDVPNSFGKVALGAKELEKLLILDKMADYLTEEREKIKYSPRTGRTVDDILGTINIKYGGAKERKADNGKTNQKRKK